jgi:hypothetical protein
VSGCTPVAKASFHMKSYWMNGCSSSRSVRVALGATKGAIDERKMKGES